MFLLVGIVLGTREISAMLLLVGIVLGSRDVSYVSTCRHSVRH